MRLLLAMTPDFLITINPSKGRRTCVPIVSVTNTLVKNISRIVDDVKSISEFHARDRHYLSGGFHKVTLDLDDLIPAGYI